MGIRASKPLFCYSKLFCISVIYLFTTLFLVLYTSLISPTNCLFRYSPYDPIQTPLFLYNSSYGEHKHALPTFRSSCNSPVYFSGTYKIKFSLIRWWFCCCLSNGILFFGRLLECFEGNEWIQWEFNVSWFAKLEVYSGECW